MKPLEWHGTNKPYTAMDVILDKQKQYDEEKRAKLCSEE